MPQSQRLEGTSQTGPLAAVAPCEILLSGTAEGFAVNRSQDVGT